MERRVQEHQKRRATAQKGRSDYSIELLEEGVYRVEKSDGTAYTVNLQAKTCTCPDFRHRIAQSEQLHGVWCKHLHLCAASFLR